MGQGTTRRVNGNARRGGACCLIQVRLVRSRFSGKRVVRVLVIRLIDVGVSMTWIRDGVGMRGHLWNGQGVSLFTDVLTRWMEGRCDGGGTLSDDTHHTTGGVRQVEGGTCATELIADDLEEEIVLGDGQGASIAFHPANVIVSHERHFHVSRNGFLLGREGRCLSKNRGHLEVLLRGFGFLGVGEAGRKAGKRYIESGRGR